MKDLHRRLNKIDIHIHTDCSDGRLSPEETVKLFFRHGYKTISITDHDAIDGYLVAKEIVKEYNITLIPGVEISSTHKNTEVHLLAYYFDENYKPLLNLLEYIHSSRINRAKKIIQNLKQINIHLDFDKIYKKVGKSGIISRNHIARELMKIDKNLTVNEIFDKYLNEHSPLFEPKQTVSAKESISLIKKAGGIAVLAHPHRLRDHSIIHNVIILGVDGLEIYCPKSSHYHMNLFFEIATKNGLIITGGSDFHGEAYELADFGSFSLSSKYLKMLNDLHQNNLTKTKGVSIERAKLH